MRKTNPPTDESHHLDRRDFLKSTGKGVLGVAAAAASATVSYRRRLSPE